MDIAWDIFGARSWRGLALGGLMAMIAAPVVAGGMMGGHMGMGAMMGGPRGSSAAPGTSGTQDGQRLYQQNCARCHGADGAGGIRFGDTVSADLRAPDLEQMYGGDDRNLARAILTGIDEKGEALDQIMPRWRGRLTKDQVASIIAYLKTLRNQ